MAPAEWLNVEVVYCPRPGVADVVPLRLAPGSTAADALRVSGLVQRHGLSPQALKLGIWSRLLDPSTVLREHDRVELYRPLLVDPKQARRLRHQRHKAA